jgi:hypothetical protein
MNSLDFGMVHTCQIKKVSQDQRLNFVSGVSPINEGHRVQGSISGAFATIKTVVIESGAWVSGDAAGYLILSFVSGLFQDGETLEEDSTRQAVVSGKPIPQANRAGTPITSEMLQPSKCLFTDISSGSGIQYFEGGEFVVKEPLLFLPAIARIERGDFVIGESPGYDTTYRVMKVGVLNRLFSTIIDHKEAELQAVEKRNG